MKRERCERTCENCGAELLLIHDDLGELRGYTCANCCASYDRDGKFRGIARANRS